MKFLGMSSNSEDRVSDERDSSSHSSGSHASHAQILTPDSSSSSNAPQRMNDHRSTSPLSRLPTWTFPSSTSSRNSPSLKPIDPSQSVTETIFSPRPAGQLQSNPAPELDLAVPAQSNDRAQSTVQPTLFTTPNRSIFSSGPPTSSVSSNTARASMSSPPPIQSTLPLSALTSSNTGINRRSVHYHDGPSISRKGRLPRAEKDIDDPSALHENLLSSDIRGSSTPTTLTRLFAAPETTPVVSRHSSYIRTSSGTAYTRSTAANTAPLPNHLYNRGLLSGKHSDITIHAFGNSYHLHRLLLDRAPFFSSALSEPWFESSAKEMTLHPDELDTNITQAAFELALKRLYGCHVAAEEDKETVGLFATGCWLEMPDLIEASVNSILRQMSPARLGPLIKLVTNNYYGKHGDRILASAKAMLCREGWEMPIRFWDGVSGEIAREIIGGDGFFVEGEWQRFLVAKKVLDRKLKARAAEAGLLEDNLKPRRAPADTIAMHAIRFDSVYRKNSFSGRVPEAFDPWLALYTYPDIAALLVLLDEGIHYVHLSFERLQEIRRQRDVLGLPLMPEKVINDALWMQMELRQRVVNARELDLELGLSQDAEDVEQEDAVQHAQSLHVPSIKGKERDVGANEDREPDEIESGSWDGNAKPRKFWIPNLDSTSIMGGNPDAALYALPSTNRPYVSRLSASIDPVDVQWASDFTASGNERPTTTDRNDALPHISYSNYPPFRFAAEFPNPRNLKEKKRVYSRTVWYAGSLWNVYIQKVETAKNTQLGVYLHRAKDKEGHEEHHHNQSSSIDSQVEMLMRRHRHRRHSRGEYPDEDSNNSSADPDATLVTPDQPSRATAIRNLLGGHGSGNNNSEASSLMKSSQTPTTPGAHPYSHNLINGPNSDSENENAVYNNRDFSKSEDSVPTIPAYVDGRPTIKTYFKIYSPSKGGRMLSVYESAPDLFNFSQSWGWKSSTMVLDDSIYGIDGAETATGNNAGGKGGKEGRLRFMVVIGNV